MKTKDRLNKTLVLDVAEEIDTVIDELELREAPGLMANHNEILVRDAAHRPKLA
jgi:hypothetical protein